MPSKQDAPSICFKVLHPAPELRRAGCVGNRNDAEGGYTVAAFLVNPGSTAGAVGRRPEGSITLTAVEGPTFISDWIGQRTGTTSSFAARVDYDRSSEIA
jgi:hypothetical protein